MVKTSTSQELIRYAYNETDLLDGDRIQRTIDGDPLIQDQFNELVSVISALDDGYVKPSQRTVSNILAFSKGY